MSQPGKCAGVCTFELQSSQLGNINHQSCGVDMHSGFPATKGSWFVHNLFLIDEDDDDDEEWISSTLD